MKKEKKELREGLKKLDVYANQLGINSLFLEEGPTVAMDSLILGLAIGGELSIDITCNFIHVPELGNVVQFYGQLQLDQILEEEPNAFTEQSILQMINRLNHTIPLGQLLYMQGQGEEEPRHALGIRYTLLTDLDDAKEWDKCGNVIKMLMDIYEVLCSTLLLLLEGESLESAMDIVEHLME